MLSYILKRVGAGAVLLVLVTVATFLVMYVNGERVVRTLVGDNAPPEQIAARTTQLGLDRPVAVQLGDWMWKALQGDLGTSYFTSEPVLQAVLNRLPITLSLVTCSILVLAVLSGLLGVAAGVRQGGLVDRVVQVLSELFSSVPKFWLALMLVLGFAINLRVFPATGYAPLANGIGAWALALFLPVTAIVLGELRVVSMVRGSIADELRKDYVRTLRARGLGTTEILFRNVLRNASGPWLALMSMKVVALLGGVVVIEQVFALPGIGQLAATAATGGDIPVLMGVVVMITVTITIVYIVFDLLAAWLNPKVRLA
jgi:peptide/nickel transport system permease protein